MIQIIHIEGERKGDIENFYQTTITLGRNPSCDVVFPHDALFIARHHAEISHMAGDYLFTNYGSNGSAVNGVRVDKTLLNNADVITFSNDGPKVSFLCKNIQPLNPSQASDVAGPNDDNGEFTLQYGNYIKSFNKFSVSLGQDTENDFAISHPALAGFHATLFYLHENFYIKDLNKIPRIKINGKIASSDYILCEQDIISLAHTGPLFRYLGKGKFAEYKQREASGRN